ncbi:MAG TPA: hypothetical protein VLT58_12830 [Polyangia bacterium]|nr:hypothetical protein [Polyangia bacterium]
MCTAPTGCTKDADCTDPLPRCDVAGGGQCVQCVMTADCTGALVCDPGTHRCLECTPVAAGACSPDLAGSSCLPGGQCGCTKDADCGTTTSGRVCDVSLARCVPGCRGDATTTTGSNGCPMSEVCTSTTVAIGVCHVVAPPADGGVTDGGSADGHPADGGAGLDSGAGGRPDGGSSSGAAGAGGGGGNTGSGASGGSGATSGSGASGGSGADGGADAGPSNIGAWNYVAGGGCRCDLNGGSPVTSLGGILIGLVAVLLRRRTRPF